MLWIKKMLFSIVCNLRRLVFNNSSPVHPISESIELLNVTSFANSTCVKFSELRKTFRWNIRCFAVNSISFHDFATFWSKGSRINRAIQGNLKKYIFYGYWNIFENILLNFVTHADLLQSWYCQKLCTFWGKNFQPKIMLV